jgi:hypothetical protein
MDDSTAKKYFKKINTTFTGVNKTDEFAKVFLNLLKSGNMTLYQKERRERRIFEDTWMKTMEDAVPVIDKLTRNPKENIKTEKEVVPIELARKVGKESVRHLATNTQNIRSVDKEGLVKPTKILTTYYESDLGTYENRFLKTLVDKIYLFVEKRYDILVRKMHTEYVNVFNVKSDTNWNGANIDFDLTLKVQESLPADEIDIKNKEMFERMTDLRTNLTNIKMSNFMQAMKSFLPITPPIQRTNIISKNTDFKTCYSLWTMMDSIDQIGFDVEVYERDTIFEDDFIEDVNNALMVFFATIAEHQKDEFSIAEDNPYEFRQEKKPKIVKNIPQDILPEAGHIQLGSNVLNQFYLDQIKRANYSRFKSLKEAGMSIQESIDIVFAQLNNITNGVYEDYIKSTFEIHEEERSLEEKILDQEEILKVYKMVEQLKRDDLKQIATNKAIALLEIRNLKDDLKDKIAAEKAEAERIRAEKEALEEKERIAKELAEIEKLIKIQQAHQVLESAARRRYEKQAKETQVAKEKALLAKQKLKEKMAEQTAKEKAAQKLKEAKEKERRLERERLEKQRIRQQELREARLEQEHDRLKINNDPTLPLKKINISSPATPIASEKQPVKKPVTTGKTPVSKTDVKKPVVTSKTSGAKPKVTKTTSTNKKPTPKS